MTHEETYFLATSTALKDAEKSQMFGKPCFKIKGKAFVCFFNNKMVFKLGGEFHKEALNLEGTQLFDPSGKNRPMKEWVQIPFSHKDSLKKFAEQSLIYVSEK